MPTARATLAAEHRELTGKKVARLRHAGRLPAVVYGHGVASDSISIDAHEFEQLRRHTGPNALVDLSVDGAKAQPVLVSSVQVHPVNRRALHVDLFLVRMTEELTVDVPLVGHRRIAGDRRPRRHAAPPDRVRPHPGAPRSPAAGHRVLDRVARRLRHDDPRPRPGHPRGRDPDDRRRRDRGQGPGPARRGGPGRGRGRDRRGCARRRRGRRGRGGESEGGGTDEG